MAFDFGPGRQNYKNRPEFFLISNVYFDFKYFKFLYWTKIIYFENNLFEINVTFSSFCSNRLDNFKWFYCFLCFQTDKFCSKVSIWILRNDLNQGYPKSLKIKANFCAYLSNWTFFLRNLINTVFICRIAPGN